jgi:hypothetical protein
LQAELSDDGRNKEKTVLKLTSGNRKAGEAGVGRNETKGKGQRKGVGLKDPYYD